MLGDPEATGASRPIMDPEETGVLRSMDPDEEEEEIEEELIEEEEVVDDDDELEQSQAVLLVMDDRQRQSMLEISKLGFDESMMYYSPAAAAHDAGDFFEEVIEEHEDEEIIEEEYHEEEYHEGEYHEEVEETEHFEEVLSDSEEHMMMDYSEVMVDDSEVLEEEEHVVVEEEHIVVEEEQILDVEEEEILVENSPQQRPSQQARRMSSLSPVREMEREETTTRDISEFLMDDDDSILQDSGDDVDDEDDDDWLYGPLGANDHRRGSIVEVTDENEEEITSRLCSAIHVALDIFDDRWEEVYSKPPPNIHPSPTKENVPPNDNSSSTHHIITNQKSPLAATGDNIQNQSRLSNQDGIQIRSAIQGDNHHHTGEDVTGHSNEDTQAESRLYNVMHFALDTLEAFQFEMDSTPRLYDATKLAMDTLEARQMEVYAKPPDGYYHDAATVKMRSRDAGSIRVYGSDDPGSIRVYGSNAVDAADQRMRRDADSIRVYGSNAKDEQADPQSRHRYVGSTRVYGSNPDGTQGDHQQRRRAGGSIRVYGSSDPNADNSREAKTYNAETMSDTSSQDSSIYLPPSSGLLWAVRASMNMLLPRYYRVPPIASLKDFENNDGPSDSTGVPTSVRLPSRKVHSPQSPIQSGEFFDDSYLETSNKYPLPEVHSLWGAGQKETQRIPDSARVHGANGGERRPHRTPENRSGSPTSVALHQPWASGETKPPSKTKEEIAGPPNHKPATPTQQYKSPASPPGGLPLEVEVSYEGTDRSEARDSFPISGNTTFFSALSDEIEPSPRQSYQYSQMKPTTHSRSSSHPSDEEQGPWDEYLPVTFEKASAIYESDFIVAPRWFQQQVQQQAPSRVQTKASSPSSDDNFLRIWIFRVLLALLVAVPFGIAAYLTISKKDDEDDV